MAKIILNGKPMTADVESDTPLLWVIRDELNMTGTKFGCGIGTDGLGQRGGGLPERGQGESTRNVADVAHHRACRWALARARATQDNLPHGVAFYDDHVCTAL